MTDEDQVSRALLPFGGLRHFSVNLASYATRGYVKKFARYNGPESPDTAVELIFHVFKRNGA